MASFLWQALLVPGVLSVAVPAVTVNTQTYGIASDPAGGTTAFASTWAPTSTVTSSSTSSASLVTTTALDGSDTPPNHWLPDRPDQYVCEYLGENDCWEPSITEAGPPYNGTSSPTPSPGYGHGPGHGGFPHGPHHGGWGWGGGSPYMGWEHPRPPRQKTCVVKSYNDPTKDDAPAIVQAFQECKENAHIIFENTTYTVATVMNTTGLRNVDVEVKGTLAWDNSDIDYWIANSLYIGFQNQTSAWFFGGENVHFYGHGYGTLNGNGQVWYLYANGTGNLHGRPHAITISESSDCVIEGLNFVKSQMWTMTVARSERILLQDINVNNTCEPGIGTFPGCNLNTDGCDTVYANNITFLRWSVDNGDDSIALKQNSTNIYVADSKFYSGQGIAVGSIGQYPGQIEVIENFTAQNIECYHTTYGSYLKTWTGLSKGYTPNGGGGGIGHGKNLTFDGFTLTNVSKAWEIEQNESYNGQQGGNMTSRFKWSDVQYLNSAGTIRGKNVVTLFCSAAAPCEDITIENNQFSFFSNGSVANEYLCTNVINPQGFTCTGPVTAAALNATAD